jgi:outer membrane lipoprotein SlyB
MKLQTVIVPFLLAATLTGGCASPDLRYSNGKDYRSGATRSNEGYYAVITSIDAGSTVSDTTTIAGAGGGGSFNHESGSASERQDVYSIRVRFDDRSYQTITQAGLDGLHVGDSVRIERNRVRRY